MTTKSRPNAPQGDAQPADYVARNTFQTNLTLVCDVPIDAIHPSPLNPRKQFDEQALQELADSIAADGLLEPIVVRDRKGTLSAATGEPPSFEIIAGERRWRAAKLAGLQTLAARIMEPMDDATALRLALLENLQRADLDPIEEAEGYRALARELGLKQTEIAAAVKRSQPAIAKSMSLLDLPDDVVAAMREGRLSVAHGVALAKYKKFPAACSAIAAQALAGATPSHQLERSIPGVYELERAGVLKSLHVYGVPFDVAATCEHCPYGAYRPLADGLKVCLNPAHFDELASEAQRRAQEDLAARTEAATAQGQALLKREDLGRADYRRVWDPAPTGCTESCPCRGQMVSFGERLVPICTDAERYDRLGAADDARQKTERAARYAERAQRLQERLASVQGDDRRAVAVVVQAALSRMQADVVRKLLAASTRAARIKSGPLTDWRFSPDIGVQLAALPVGEQLALALEALVGHELEQARTYDAQQTSRFDWLVGPDAPAAQVRCLDCGAAVPTAEAIGEPRGPLCPACASAAIGVRDAAFGGTAAAEPTAPAEDRTPNAERDRTPNREAAR